MALRRGLVEVGADAHRIAGHVKPEVSLCKVQLVDVDAPQRLFAS